MMGAKMAVAKYCAELKIADASPRSLAGNHADVRRPLPGNDGASAAPTARRSVNSAATAAPPVRKPTVPWNNVKRDHNVRPKKYVVLEPNRSRSQPPGNWAST